MNETTSAPLANAIEAPLEDVRMPPPQWRRFAPRWLRGLVWVDEARQYDAFLSYSWKADSDIAPLLQSVIQRFLCSWYRVRARTLFRDLSSLAAGALLDDELRARLDRSDRLIVLVSPAAAASRGMEFESAHWIRAGRPVILVLTGGTATEWAEIRATLLPASLASSLTKEPVIVDIRQQVGRFRSGEFDRSVRGELIESMRQLLLAFYPNGTTWESLRGEERRQRRNALTWLSCGVLALLLTTVVAVVGAYTAYQQTIVAQRETQAAKDASQVAEDARIAAVESKERAEAQRRLAVGRSLAVTAGTLAKDRNDDAPPTLLAALVVEALKRIPEPEGRALAATVGLRLSQAVPFSHRPDQMANVTFLDGRDTLAMVEFATGLDLKDFQSGQSRYVPASQFGADGNSAPNNSFSILSRTSPYVIVEAGDSYSYVLDTASLKVHALPADSWSIQYSPDRQSFGTLSSYPKALNIFHLPSFKRIAIPLEEYSGPLLAHTSAFTVLPAASGLRLVWPTGESRTFTLPGGLDASSVVSDGKVLYVAAFLPQHSSGVPPPEPRPGADESASAPRGSAREPNARPSTVARPAIRPGIFKLDPKSGHFSRIFDGDGFLRRFGETQLIVAGKTRAALLDLKNTRAPIIVQLNGSPAGGSVYEPQVFSSRRWIALKAGTGWHFIDGQTGTQWFVSQQGPKAAKLAYDTSTAVLIGEGDMILVQIESQTVLARLEGSAEVEKVSISDSGRLLAIGSQHGASVVRLDPSQLLSYLCSEKGVNMRPEDWNRYIGDEPWQPTCITWTNPSDTLSKRK